MPRTIQLIHLGADGYPRNLWDKTTGKIDHTVANYMRDHGFVGDMDNYSLNLGVYGFEDFMKTTDAGATFEYGRPMKGHGWHPMSDAELVNRFNKTFPIGIVCRYTESWRVNPGVPS